MKKAPAAELIDRICSDKQVRTAVTRESHEWFFTIYLSHYVKSPSAPFHEKLFALTDDPDWKLLCLMAFRGSGKSTIFTTSYPLWAILGKQRKKFVVIFCLTRNQAKQHMMNLRQELENNQLLKDDLGPFKEEDEWGSSSLVFSRSGARITVASVEQSIRGVRHREHRPDLIICDDVEDLASTKTQEGRDKTYQWFSSDVLPVGDMNTRIVIVGNLLHEDSLLMQLRRGIESEERSGIVRKYPLIDENGAVLWPGKYPTKESLDKQKRTIGSESAWQREFLLRIITDDDQIVRPEWIRYYDVLPLDGHLTDFRFAATGIDLAISEKETADYTAMVSGRIFGSGQNFRIYIQPNPVNERLDFPKTVERAMGVSRILGGGMPTKLYIENVGYQQAFVDHLRTQGMPAEEFKTLGQDKRARLTLTSNLIQSGKVLFPRHGADLLIRQLVSFGKERHDDLADAFAILILKVLEGNQRQFFLDWNPGRHIVPVKDVPQWWKRFRSIHPSPRNGTTSCHWYALDDKGIVWAYKEHHTAGLDHDEHAKRIAKLSENADEVQENYLFTVMNSEEFAKTGFAESVKEIYERHGVVDLIPSGTDREDGWDAINQRLRLSGQDAPKLRIFDTCTNLIRTLPLLVPDSKKPADIDTSGETAAVDDLRYILQTIRDQKTPPPLSPVERRLQWIKEQENPAFDYHYSRN